MIPPKPHPIEGSRFWRVWCARCGTPMRVPKSETDQLHWCEECDPPHMGVGGPISSPITYDERNTRGGYADSRATHREWSD